VLGVQLPLFSQLPFGVVSIIDVSFGVVLIGSGVLSLTTGLSYQSSLVLVIVGVGCSFTGSIGCSLATFATGLS